MKYKLIAVIRTTGRTAAAICAVASCRRPRLVERLARLKRRRRSVWLWLWLWLWLGFGLWLWLGFGFWIVVCFELNDDVKTKKKKTFHMNVVDASNESVFEQLKTGVQTLLYILRRLSAPHLAMMTALIPYGAGCEIPIDRSLGILARMSTEQFAAIVQVSGRSSDVHACVCRASERASERACVRACVCAMRELNSGFFGTWTVCRAFCVQLQQAVDESNDAQLRERRQLVDTLMSELSCSEKELAGKCWLFVLR